VTTRRLRARAGAWHRRDESPYSMRSRRTSRRLRTAATRTGVGEAAYAGERTRPALRRASAVASRAHAPHTPGGAMHGRVLRAGAQRHQAAQTATQSDDLHRILTNPHRPPSCRLAANRQELLTATGDDAMPVGNAGEVPPAYSGRDRPVCPVTQASWDCRREGFGQNDLTILNWERDDGG
jgi:hypothetical protein